MHNIIMMLMQDPPSPSLNINLSIMVDHFIIPVASKTSGSASSSTLDCECSELCDVPNVTRQTA